MASEKQIAANRRNALLSQSGHGAGLVQINPGELILQFTSTDPAAELFITRVNFKDFHLIGQVNP